MVYKFWIGRQESTNQNQVNILKSAAEIGKMNLEKIASSIAEQNEFDWTLYHDYLSQNLVYDFGEAEQAGLKEFFHYAFSYSMVEYVPDFNFF